MLWGLNVHLTKGVQMNKKFYITIPLKDSEERVGVKGKLTVNMMLDPYYISETSLLSVFVSDNEYKEYLPLAREIIFNSSLRSLEFTYNKLNSFSEEHKLILRRELALCFAINTFSNHFYQGFQESLHRSKSFSDFTVTTTVKNSPELLKDMISSSSNCIKEAKAEIVNSSSIANSLGLSSVKGSENLSNSFTYRTWIHDNLPIKSSGFIGNGKIWYQGNLYKDMVNVSNT